MYPRHWVAVVCLRFSLNAARPGAGWGLRGLVCRGGGLGARSAVDAVLKGERRSKNVVYSGRSIEVRNSE